jgi:16S rRNA (cytosine967-C5)-methyltransferase
VPKNPKQKTKTIDPRMAALTVLNTMATHHKTLDSVLDEFLARWPVTSRRDKAFFFALVYGVLRWQGRLDWFMGHFSKTPLKKIKLEIQNILRLGLFQIIHLSRIPDSAAVNTSVELTKAFGPPWIVKFVNGILRNAARNHETVPFPDPEKTLVAHLAAQKSFPVWLIDRWLNRFGYGETASICDAVNHIPPITVRTNDLLISREALAKKLEKMVEKIVPTAICPLGISFSSPQKPIFEMEEFTKGYFQVQDEAAQLVTLLLHPRPGDTILDACAGLGGKTGYIAQLMKNKGRIVALDTNAEKLLRLESEMTRLGISIVSTKKDDLETITRKKWPLSFDRILLDAPCSGLGVMRRNPDTKWNRLSSDLETYQSRQVRFLHNLSPLVKKTGLMIYTVCSTEPEENESVVELFLNNHPEFVIEKKLRGLPESAGRLVDNNGFIRTFPNRHNMDGFFSVALQRIK